MKNYDESFSITSVSFYLYFLFISPGKHTLVIAVISNFLLDCLLNVFFLYFGSIFGYWVYLLVLLSNLLGDSLKIVFFPLLLSFLYSELIVFGVINGYSP